MFDTPKEAALTAENARLRAENDYLRRAFDSPVLRVEPYAIVEEMLASSPLPPRLEVVRRCGVEGKIQDDLRWHVLAHHERLDGGRFEVSYYTPSWRDPNVGDDVFVNRVLPDTHRRFISMLAAQFRTR